MSASFVCIVRRYVVAVYCDCAYGFREFLYPPETLIIQFELIFCSVMMSIVSESVNRDVKSLNFCFSYVFHQ